MQLTQEEYESLTDKEFELFMKTNVLPDRLNKKKNES